ncbi:FAD-binding oxidoreductase [Marinovum sp. 2_MG-2023]|uniref:NAD(P)/FAD-dependent oxidoreductase n=1 Tax=unclassified Marinovum TaxID=2647166 RepID=UPI0026E3A47C|nr:MULTISPECIES: FAD-binding oxidoreductase [unclassified Marinovum]MDO6729223.1 FAD-binding oxidoreductase [Marinovum sp. 2_MG-2023]MDO6779150.1 FAD-binding oxidoreductase [Marinovum sp. 1_MG-2023]
MTEQKVTVLGAGMVGVCTALELQRRGVRVTLVDRKAPGQETSFGNAGVLARSSLIPINNPGLWSNLPKLIGNKSTALRYDPMFVARNLAWALQFLTNARASKCEDTAKALNDLITLSIGSHLKLMQEFGLQDHLSDQGWMFLYRNEKGFDGAGANRALMARHGVPFEALSPAALADLEPDLKPIYAKAVWIKGSYSVNNPGAIVAAYARAFTAAGGRLVLGEATTMAESDDGVVLTLADGATLASDQLAVCCGPWAKTFLSNMGYRVRMAFERGYHRHFTGRTAGVNALGLNRPICDASAGFVLAPMQAGLRLTSGVELADNHAPQNTDQISQAERAARAAIDLGERVDDQTWLGSRPTFPDSRPAIGMAPGSRRVALGIGHQHIGFMSGSGTGLMLADILMGRPSCIDATPFRPERYIRRA